MKCLTPRFTNKFSLSLIFILSLLVAGCGDDGSTGPAGPAGADGAAGPTGPSGPVQPTAITETMGAEITAAEVAADGSLTVTFELTNDTNFPFIGLSSSYIRFTLVQLIPADIVSGDSTQW